MEPEDERQSNPFLEQLKSYGVSLPGRLIQTPIRAAKLPFQLLQDVTGMGGARSGEEVEALQRDLATQVTGKEVPYSEGRRYANAFSLGLIPNNKYPTINPQQLGPEEQQRFEKLTPLQQRLLQSKRPRDFADMLNDDSLFAERQPEPLTVVGRDERLADKHGQVVLDAIGEDKVVPPGAAIARNGELIATNEWVDPTLAESRGAAADASRATADLRRAEAGAVPSKVALNEAKAAEAQAKADAEAAAPSGPSLGDRNKIGGMEKRANDGVAARVKDLDRGFTAARNAQQLFELRDSASLPATYRRELVDMGFQDIDSRDPRSVQDLMFMTMGVRAADPPGRITDKDVDMYSRARAYFDPGIIEAVRQGQVLTNAQRSEMMVAIKKITTGLLTTNDLAVVDGRKTALRDLVLGQGVGMNPANIQDRAADLRQAYYGEELGDQAAYPAADRETEALLEQLWDIKNPGKAPTASDLVRFANEHGFRIQEFEQ